MLKFGVLLCLGLTRAAELGVRMELGGSIEPSVSVEVGVSMELEELGGACHHAGVMWL